MKNAKEILKHFQKTQFSPLLKANGYTLQGSHYTQATQDIIRILRFWQWRYNSASEARFQLDFGIYVPRLASWYWRDELPVKPALTHAYLSASTHMLDESLPIEYSTKPEPPEDEAFGHDDQGRILAFKRHNRLRPFSEAISDISVKVLPFLNRFANAEETLDFVLNLDPVAFRRFNSQSFRLHEYTTILCGLCNRHGLAAFRFAQSYLNLKPNDPLYVRKTYLQQARELGIDLPSVVRSRRFQVKHFLLSRLPWAPFA